MSAGPPPCRAAAPSPRSFARPRCARLRVSSSTYSLCASCSSRTSISLTSCSRLGHWPVRRQTTQRTISARPCRMIERSGDGDDRLERIDRRAFGHDARMLADAPGDLGEMVAGVEQRRDPGQEEDDVEDEVEGGLRPRPHRAVEEIAAHVGVLRQGVGPGQHEQRAVEHVVGVVDPCRRRVQDVALEDLDAHLGRQHDDEPGRSLAHPGADGVDRCAGIAGRSCGSNSKG